MNMKIKNKLKTDKTADNYQETIQIIKNIHLLNFQIII
jgi:hypothetical protein